MTENVDDRALPQGWVRRRLGDLGVWVGGGTPSKRRDIYWTDGTIPWVSPKDMKSDYITASEDAITEEAVGGSAAKLIPAGSVLFVTRSGILQHTLPVAVTKVEVTVNQDLKAVIPNGTTDPSYLLRYVQAYNREILNDCAKDGTTVQSIEIPKLRSYVVPLAPLAEQRRIVEKIEELFSDLDAGVQALETVRRQLSRYRQSVLKAAVEGDLTRDWRERHPDAEPAPTLLARILEERRARWEKDTLKKYEATGRKPPKDWQARYPEPAAPDTTELPELPEGWVWTSLGEAFEVHVGATPSRRNPAYWNGTIPWANSGEVGLRRITATAEAITEEGLANSSTRIHPKQTLLLGMIGQGPTRGQVAMLEIEAANSQNAATIYVSITPVLPAYVYHYLDSQYRQLRQLGAGNNQKALNKSIVETIVLPLPPLAEQKAIVEAVEERLSVADAVAAEVERQLRRARTLRRSILQRAFEGKLVPQDPNDEPAADLLARIKAEKQPKPQKPRNTRAQQTEIAFEVVPKPRS